MILKDFSNQWVLTTVEVLKYFLNRLKIQDCLHYFHDKLYALFLALNTLLLFAMIRMLQFNISSLYSA